MSSPLAGLRVLELATDIAGPYAGKLLADAGADVVKVEPATGDPLRGWTSIGAPLPEGEDGVLFRFLNTSKRSVVVPWAGNASDVAGGPGGGAGVTLRASASPRDFTDPSRPDDPSRRSAGARRVTPAPPPGPPEPSERLRELVAWADVVIDSVGIAWDAVAALHARTSLVSISWFGRTGPWTDRPATEFTVQAWSGATALRGTVDQPPLSAGGRVGEWLAGGYAAIGALAAVTSARRTGRGSHVDLSVLEVVHLSMAPFATVVASFGGLLTGRTVEIPSIEPAADGWVGFCTITNQQWRDFLVLIGRDDLVDDAELAHYFTRNARRAEVYAMIHAWSRRHGVAEIIERATELRIPAAAIGNGETVTELEQFKARGVYVPAPEGDVRQPRPPYRLARGTLRPFTRAPRLGEHEHDRFASAAPTPAGDGETLPFEGLRVIDLTMFWAGPFVGHFLATLGADVVKLESVQRPDGIRFASTQQPTADRWWEWCAMFHGMNAGKRGITLDLSRPRGVELARALIARADVVVENFSPRVLDNLGLRYEDLARENPGLVMLRMPAFGLDGPWRDRTGFAQTMEQVSGLAWVTGFADGPPVIPRGPCDPLAGMHATFALLAALEHRRRTGEGQLVEATMVEAALNAAAEQTLEWQAHGRLLGRDGNRGPTAAPQNLYACRGTEQWIAIAVATDAQWSALVEVLGRPAWALAPELAGRDGRRAAHDRIDDELARVCAEAARDALVDRLLAAGVPAAPVVHPSELARNPQVRSRGFLEAVAHPVTGTHELPGLPMRFSGIARWHRAPAPTLGEHTAAVLAEVLGVDAAELARLRADGIVGERPAGL